LPAWGIDPSEYLKQVVIVGANEGDRQVSLMTWISNGTNKGFTEDGSGASLRRFVASAAPVQALSPSIAARGLRAPMAKGLAESGSQYVVKRATKIDSSVWDISITYTDSHEASSLERNWRWIPNTGEYLVIGNIKLVFSNRGEISLDGNRALLGKSYSLSIGAVDRKYDAQKGGEGNIYNNKGKSFELAVLGNDTFNTNTPVLAATLTKGAADVYTTTMPSSSRFSVDERGVVSYIVTDYMGKSMSSYDYFGVRPSSGQAYAGDDILLSATLAITNAHNEKVFWPLSLVSSGKPVNEDVRIKADEAKYLAVYDKKMLWRANLYINEDMNDWNDLHPWNAPPAPGVAAAGGNPSWWSDAWGYNEWNRNSESDTSFVSISVLPSGNGKQVIGLPVYTPIVKASASRGNNKLSGRVEYSYPYEYLDGHFDSPFDFKKKLQYERSEIKNYYTINPTISITATTTVGGDSVPGEIANQSLKSWSSTEAPMKVWGHYLTKNFYLANSTSGVAAGLHYSFIPGLGLYSLPSKKGEAVTGDLPVLSATERPGEATNTSPYPAGTDCLGLAKRAASYSSVQYSWGKLANGWAENGELSPGNGGRSFPLFKDDINNIDQRDLSREIWTRGITSFSKVVESASNWQSEQEKIGCIIPGDIFYYYYKIGAETKSHIAIVADVQWFPDGRVEDVSLIEATFGTLSDGVYAQYVKTTSRLSTDYLDSSPPHYHVVRLN
jgi:hypothetical protein